jgi:ATP-dependent DNA helicase RecQ
VEENEIIRPMDMQVKSPISKSGLKVFIIQGIDRKVPLEDLAMAKNLSIEELMTELESIVSSGTKVDLNYYIDEYVDPYHQEEIFEYFRSAETDSVEQAHQELGEQEYTEEEIRLIRLKFMSEVGN